MDYGTNKLKPFEFPVCFYWTNLPEALISRAYSKITHTTDVQQIAFCKVELVQLFTLLHFYIAGNKKKKKKIMA